VRSLRLIFQDLYGLFVVQSLLLAATFLLTASDRGDLRTQIAWLIFLIPGWFLASAWTGSRACLATRYMHAVISSMAAHGCLVCLGYWTGAGFDSYFVAFAVVTGITLWLRARKLASAAAAPQRLPTDGREILVWLAVMVLVVSIYRMPRSNDVAQFSLQQQDMAAERSLQPSSIGMSALDVDRTMPRWRAHYWHLWACLIADATSLPVTGVLHRWAPIPLAFAVIVSLIQIIRRISGRPVPLWAVALAVFGPVVLWYRAYNAFNYSFRLTNNFCLDKDISLFLIVPAAIYLSTRVMRGSQHYVWPLLLLIPAIVKFHPMTAVYLVALLPFLVLGYGRFVSRAAGRFPLPEPNTTLISLAALALFATVVVIGDAQSSHENINRVIRMDFADAQQSRPLHYWVGLYAAVEDHGLNLDTTAWTDGRIHLRARVIWDCGLFATAHIACLIWLLSLAMDDRKVCDLRRWIAAAVTLALLWWAWLMSPLFLSHFPHYLAGYERMHWFAYLPALVAVTRAVTIGGATISTCCSPLTRHLNASRRGWVGPLTVSLLLVASSLSFLRLQPTILEQVRVLSSLLDFELDAQSARIKNYRADVVNQTLESAKPPYLGNDDRVLFLDASGNDQYWLIKQGVFWSEPYAEAYALEWRGDDFLVDRRYFYALLDRLPIDQVGDWADENEPTALAAGVEGDANQSLSPEASAYGSRRKAFSSAQVEDWLDQKGVTLIVDRRDGAGDYLNSFDSTHPLDLELLKPGVWRRRAISE
jgi:hypothetical protein